ncbi:hypothetical protein GGR52DRAFT_318804 [Hypoxylon sp. FL1284]|nr:hypothetical protein GGR52DRAFT_318804 [Hypoxylon sp. FL1284]
MAFGVSSSRQKSCNACVRSKRRCDKRSPTCSNCIKKRLRCVYGGRPQAQSAANSADVPLAMDSLIRPPSTPGGGFLLDDDASPADFDVNFGLSTPDTLLQVDSSFDYLINPTFETSYGLSAASSLTTKTLTLQDYSRMLPMCEGFAPWQLSDPSSTAAYVMSVFKNLHVTFGREGSTIYVHRNLYLSDTPRWILQAFSMSVLYTNQTPATRGYVLKLLHEHVNSLVETASSTALTPREKLARVHAMMTYQTIRMFDGDVSLGQQAEEDLHLLEFWTNELGKLKDNLDDLAEADAVEIRSKPPESWERWLFAESVRRTYIISHSLKAFWELLKGRRCAADMGIWRYVHRWTLSKHLWDAPDPVDFFTAWSEKPIWIISSFDLEDLLRSGTRDDADEFALVFLTM